MGVTHSHYTPIIYLSVYSIYFPDQYQELTPSEFLVLVGEKNSESLWSSYASFHISIMDF